MLNITEFRKNLSRQSTKPVVQLLSKTRIKPNTLTWLGLVLTAFTAGVIASHRLLIGGILVIVSGLFDMLDGALARSNGQSSLFGAFFDSCVDRVSEAILFMGVLIHVGVDNIIITILIFLAMIGSFLTSYLRSRAEALDIECQVGLFTRTERVIILALGLVVANYITIALPIALLIIAVFAFVTVGQRAVHVWKATK